MEHLVECIPNFSEGRRPEVVEQIVSAISSVTGIKVLDLHSDHDHNRSVVTFVGTPEAVREAAFAGCARAAELIDLNHHVGEHPRIGATDVIPIVPISGVSEQEALEIAVQLAQRIAGELSIPIYLYEKSARRPEYRNLADIRRGQFEGLREEIKNRPPDIGEPVIHPTAGATVVGVRMPLVAFNVLLDTDELKIAKRIAKNVRESGGGLVSVKAIGVQVGTRVQVSMNMTDFKRVPLYRVVELIRAEANRYGVRVHSSEVVGLVPVDALIESVKYYLQLADFKRDQILEFKLLGGDEREA